MRCGRCSPSFLPDPTYLLLLAAVLACAPAGRPAAAQDSSASAGYAVHGVVIDAVSGQPLSRALVKINEQFAMLTTSEGQFSFDNVPAGDYSVSIRKPGYEGFGQFMGTIVGGSGILLQTDPPRRIRVGPEMPALTFRITPLAAITGRIVLSTSDPADGIQVDAYTRRLQHGRFRWTLAAVAKTRSDGSFRFGALPAGDYIVYTQLSPDSDGPPMNGDVAVWGYPAVYYPGVTDSSAAGMISLKPGQKAEAEISLVRQRFFPITAFVRMPDQNLPINFQVLDSSGRSTGIFASYDRRTQTVHTSAPNGAWSLEARSGGRGREMLWGRSDFKVAGAPVNLAISLLPVPNIPVNIRREFAASADGSQPQTAGPGVNLFLITADDFSMNIGGGLTPVEGSNEQQWELRITEPGRYWVQAMPYPLAYISSITSGGVDLTANPLVVAPGSTPAPIEITLRNDGGSITGQIEGKMGEPSTPSEATGERSQVWIYAIPLFPSASDVLPASARLDGKFTIPNLAPGSYRVVACDEPQQIDSHSAEGLAAWATKGETVTVDPGGTAHVDLSVISTPTGATE
jgi:hypothetical protein